MTYLLTHYTENWQPIIDIVAPIHQRYCDNHGYKYILKKVPNYSVYTGLEKLEMVLENVNENDCALVLDADAMITNHQRKIYDYMPYGGTVYLSEGLNMGAFIIRGYDFGKSFIKLLMLLIENKIYNCEQDAVELLLIKGILFNSGSIKIVKHPCFNSYMAELYDGKPTTEENGQWIEGKSFVLHLPGIGMDERLRIFNEIKDKVIYE